jgi:succinoglycan biosynthesis transport protein ExoP
MSDRLPFSPPGDIVPFDEGRAFEGGGSAFFDMLTHLRRRKIFIAGVTFACCLAAFLTLLVLPRRYTAEAIIAIDFRRQHVLNIPDVSGDLPPERQTIWAVVWAEAERLKTWPLLDRVIDKLDLEHDSGARDPSAPWLAWRAALGRITQSITESIERTVGSTQPEPPGIDAARLRARDRLASGLSVTADTNSGLIHVRYTSTDPAAAARVVDALTSVYMDDQRERKRAEIEQAVDWLEAHISDLQKNAMDAHRAAEEYRIASGIYTSKGQDTASDRMAQLSDQLASSLAQEASLAARYKQIISLKDGHESWDTAPEVLASPVIQELRSTESQLVGQLGYLSQQHLDQYPEVKNTRAQLAKIREQIRDEVDRTAAGLRNQLDAAHASSENLRIRLQSAEAEVGKIKESMIKLRELEQIAGANESVYQAFLQRMKELTARIEMQRLDASIFSPAQVPDRPSSPRRALVLAFVAMVAAMGASLFVLICETHDRGFSSIAELERRTGLPALGVVPLFAGVSTAERSGYALRNRGMEALYLEMLGGVCARLRQSLRSSGARVILVTSASAREGKTTAALALARIAAHRGLRVLLIDCDLARPGLSDRIAPPQGLSLIDVLAGSAGWAEALVPDTVSPAMILPGGVRQAPFSHLDSPNVTRVVTAMREHYDLILLDAPPLLGLSDAHDVIACSEETLLVVQWRRTPQRVVADALRQLTHGGARLIGCILTQVDMRSYIVYDATELKDLAKHYYRSKSGRKKPADEDIVIV